MPLFRYHTKQDKELATRLHNVLGFYPKNICLYQLAFRHKSMSTEVVKGNKVNNERLEYLGDAVLDAIVAEFLFKKYPSQSEGFLTEMRSRIVSRASLNKLSQKLGLNDFIQYSHENHAVFRSIGGNAFEAFVGAMFLDKGYEFTKKIVVERIILILIDIESLQNTDVNFKSKLIEWAQKEKHTVNFDVKGEKGTGYNKLYEVQIAIDSKLYGAACDYSIKGAEQLAAEKTWQLMNEEIEQPA